VGDGEVIAEASEGYSDGGEKQDKTTLLLFGLYVHIREISFLIAYVAVGERVCGP
jgi:hypothetical protein